MTRYFLTLPEAITLLLLATETSIGGETYVMNMPAFHISSLAQVIIDHYGDKDTKIVEIGIREGEKLDEVLVTEHEAPRTYVYDKDYYVIAPELDMGRDYSHLQGLEKVNFKEFTSATYIKDSVYLKELLDNGGFLV